MTRSRMQKSSWYKGRLCAWTESLRKPTNPITPNTTPKTKQPTKQKQQQKDNKKDNQDTLQKKTEFVHLAKFEHAVCHSCGRYRPLSRWCGFFWLSPQCIVHPGFLCFLVCGFF